MKTDVFFSAASNLFTEDTHVIPEIKNTKLKIEVGKYSQFLN